MICLNALRPGAIFTARPPGQRRKILSFKSHRGQPERPGKHSRGPRRGDMADARHRSSICSRFGYMPQGLGKNLYPDLSVWGTSRFSPACSGGAERNTRAASVN
jgi:hypothetical protein